MSIKTKPYLKWPGSKTKLVGKIAPYIPAGHEMKRILEPFGGTGTVSLNLADRFKSAVVNDVNADLINAHQLAVSDPEWFIAELKKVFVASNLTVEGFKVLHEEFNTSSDPKRKSVLFVYLNRHCFNGLCRYSAKGM